MTHSGRFPRALVLGLLLLLCAPGVELVGAAQPATSDPMRIIPADALFCARINRLTTTLGQVDQFLTGISPIGLSMPVRAQMGKLLGAPEPAGVDMNGDFAAFGPLPGGEKPDAKRAGVLVPITNFEQFLSNPNVVKPDAQGILGINVGGKPSIAGIQIGNYVLFTRAADRQALLEAKTWTSGASTGSLAQRLTPEELKRATGSPAWIYGNVQIAAKLYGPMLQEKIKEGMKKVEEAQAKGGAMAGPPAAVMDMWVSLLNRFMKETQFVSLVLDPSAAAVRIAPVVAALPNTEFAKVLSAGSVPPDQTNLMGYLQNGAVWNGIGRVSPEFVRAITLLRLDILTALLGSSLPPDTLAQIRKLSLDSAEAFGGHSAVTFLPDFEAKPPFRARYVFTIRDKQKLNQVLDESAKLLNSGVLTELGKKFDLRIGFDFKRNVTTYKDVPIDSVNVTLQALDPNAPQAKHMQAVFGGGFNLRLAVVNNLLLYALAADPEKEIRTLIDQTLSGPPSQVPSEVQAALQLLPEGKTANFFGTYSIVRWLQLASRFAPMPLPIPSGEMPTQSNVAFGGHFGDNRLLTNIVIPKQQVLDVMAMVMKMQQEKMQEMQKEKQEKPSGTPSAPGKTPGRT